MAAAIAITGTLLGVIAGAVLAFLRDRMQWRREDSVRWYDARFAAYSTFLQAAREAEHWGLGVSIYIAKYTRERPPNEPHDWEKDSWSRWTKANDELRSQRGVLALVGSDTAIDAADNLEAALTEVVDTRVQVIGSVPRVRGDDMTIGEIIDLGLPLPQVPDPSPESEGAFYTAKGRLDDAFDRFVAAARTDLRSDEGAALDV